MRSRSEGPFLAKFRVLGADQCPDSNLLENFQVSSRCLIVFGENKVFSFKKAIKALVHAKQTCSAIDQSVSCFCRVTLSIRKKIAFRLLKSFRVTFSELRHVIEAINFDIQ